MSTDPETHNHIASEVTTPDTTTPASDTTMPETPGDGQAGNARRAAADVMFIGDPHFQLANIRTVELFIERVSALARRRQPDAIVIAGDVLHDHERLHTLALNKAYELVRAMREISPTYVLVGNHDYIQNQQFLTDHHWMNAMKEWRNTTIVDTVHTATINGYKMVFVPYVPPGRFIEALETLGEPWLDAHCIYAHQEFAGCKMGAIVSIDGDAWPETYPAVVSGHIHARQIPQRNVYYSGSAMQHAFGESEHNVIACLRFDEAAERECGPWRFHLDEVDLDLPRKRVVYIDADEIDEYVCADTRDEIKLTVSGDQQQFKAFRKTQRYADIVARGTKIVFKPRRCELRPLDRDRPAVEGVGGETGGEAGEEVSASLRRTGRPATQMDGEFEHVLYTLVHEKRDPYLLQSMYSVVYGQTLGVEDILYL